MTKLFHNLLVMLLILVTVAIIIFDMMRGSIKSN